VEAEAVAAQFLPPGSPLYQELDITGDTRTYETYTEDGAYLEGPLVVLVNENSASASEIVSSALMESGRAEVVGLTTAGTGTVLLPFDLSDGSLAVIGIELFLTGYGTDIYKHGVEPTHEVEFSDVPNDYPSFPASLSIDEDAMDQVTFDALEDPQLHFAFDLLQN
jgi:carboxyl-terminal processing protease